MHCINRQALVVESFKYMQAAVWLSLLKYLANKKPQDIHHMIVTTENLENVQIIDYIVVRFSWLYMFLWF